MIPNYQQFMRPFLEVVQANNGNELAKLMLRYNIGSRDEQVLHLNKVDEDFFEG